MDYSISEWISRRNHLFVELHFDGYEEYATHNEIDLEACRSSSCPNCGHEGLSYRPFSKPGSYRAFACCSECGWFEEF